MNNPMPARDDFKEIVSDRLRVSKEEKDGIVIFAFAGESRDASVPALREGMFLFFKNKRRSKVILDFTHLRYATSQACGVLFKIHQLIVDNRGQVACVESEHEATPNAFLNNAAVSSSE